MYLNDDVGFSGSWHRVKDIGLCKIKRLSLKVWRINEILLYLLKRITYKPF